MKNTKKTPSKNDQLLQMTSENVSVASQVVSANVFYGAFLSLSLSLALLLLGANMRVASMDVVVVATNPQQAILTNRVETLVAGYPIAEMTDLIVKQDKHTASFLVGIAKKESNWGKRVPVDEEGKDCFNYWGYRGAGSRGIAMGHGCFGSPEEAVGVVGGRIDTLVQEYQFRTAAEMVVWKCGWSCDGHSNESVKKWIADVSYYTKKIERSH